MTFAVARPRRACRITIRAPWVCECGQARLVMASNVRTDLPLETGVRRAGPCPACGRPATYRIATTDTRYFVHVGRG